MGFNWYNNLDMKTLLRNFLLNLVVLFGVSYLVPGFTFTGGFRTLALGAFGLMLINIAIIPLLKIMFLPLNILTLGLFTWVINVIALYFLTTIVPQFKLLPFFFQGASWGWIVIPPADLNVLQVAILTSFLVGLFSNFLQWLLEK